MHTNRTQGNQEIGQQHSTSRQEESGSHEGTEEIKKNQKEKIKN